MENKNIATYIEDAIYGFHTGATGGEENLLHCIKNLRELEFAINETVKCLPGVNRVKNRLESYTFWIDKRIEALAKGNKYEFPKDYNNIFDDYTEDFERELLERLSKDPPSEDFEVPCWAVDQATEDRKELPLLLTKIHSLHDLKVALEYCSEVSISANQLLGVLDSHQKNN